MFFINTWYDAPTPYHQMVDIICALQALEVESAMYKTLTIMNSAEHSFGCWSSPIVLPGAVGTPRVKDEVIDFLDEHLQ